MAFKPRVTLVNRLLPIEDSKRNGVCVKASMFVNTHIQSKTTTLTIICTDSFQQAIRQGSRLH